MSELSVVQLNPRTLPPSVDGKLRGYLHLKLEGTLSAKYSPVAVGVAVKWWGDNDFVELWPKELKNGSKSNFHLTYKYDIRTPSDQFDKYLKDCKFVRLNLIDKQFNTLISTVDIRDIPSVASQFGDRNNFVIYDIFNNAIGDLNIEFRVALKDFSSVQSRPSLKLLSEIIKDGKNLREAMMKSVLEDSCDSSIKSVDTLKYDGSMETNSSSSVQTTSDQSEMIFNHAFIPKDLSSHGSNITSSLDGIAASASGSSISAVPMELSQPCLSSHRMDSKSYSSNKEQNSTYNMVSKHQHSEKMEEAHDSISSINGLKIQIISMKLNDSGVQMVTNSSDVMSNQCAKAFSSEVSFDVKHEFPAQFATKRKIKLDDQSNRKITWFCSDSLLGQEIRFDTTSTYDLTHSTLGLSHTFRDCVINFNIFSRHANQSLPVSIGTAYFQISDLLQMKYYSQTQDIPIININSMSHQNYPLGCLKVKIGLSLDGEHFGEDLFSVLSKSGESIKRLESSQLSSDISTYVEVEPLMQGVVLHRLLHISDGQNFGLSNLFLTCREFGTDEGTVSNMCADTQTQHFHFHQQTPVLLTKELVEKSRNNLLIVEVWQRDGQLKNNLIGIAKLPIHAFFVSFRDSALVKHALNSDKPIIAVDGWVTVINPATQLAVGCFYAILCLGTEEQIQLLEKSRGMKEGSSVRCITPFVSSNLRAPNSSSSSSDCQPMLTEQTDKLLNRISHHLEQTSESINTLKASRSNADSRVLASLNDLLITRRVKEKSQCSPLRNEDLSTDPQIGEYTNSITLFDQCTQTETDSLENKSETLLSENFPMKSQVKIPRSTKSNQCVETQTDAQMNYDLVTRDSTPETLISQPGIVAENHSDCFCARVEIDSALHLGSTSTDNADKSKKSTYYVSFLTGTSETMVTSLANGSDPVWRWHENVKLSNELVSNLNERLLFKVWQSSNSSDENDCCDVHMGYAVVDLTVLAFGLKCVCGWFNIMDFMGHCNGQIKITITPLDLAIAINYGDRLPTDLGMVTDGLRKTVSSDVLQATSRKTVQCSGHESNSRECEMISLGDATDYFTPACLSDALKDKLSELDVITKRLKRRLDNVTNGPHHDQDTNLSLVDCELLPAGDPSLKYSGHILSNTSTPGFQPHQSMSGKESSRGNNNSDDLMDHADGQSKRRCTGRIDSKTVADPRLSNILSSEDHFDDDDESTNDFDALTSYLMETVAREIRLDNVFNPLLFQHLLVPLTDANASPSVGTEQPSEKSVSFQNVNNGVNKFQNLKTSGPFDCDRFGTNKTNEESCQESWPHVSSEVGDELMTVDTSVENRNTKERGTNSSSPPLIDLESLSPVDQPQSLVKGVEESKLNIRCSSSVDTQALVLQLSGLTSREAPEGGNSVHEGSVVGKTNETDAAEGNYKDSGSRLVDSMGSFELNQAVVLNKEEVKRIAKIFSSTQRDPKT